MKLCELFYSLQGEGRLLGVPSVFVRFAGCNLRCEWCDTPYALSASQGEETDPADLAAKISEFNCRHVVITGGEPLLQESLGQLCHLLKNKGMHITIETNGTIMPDLSCDLLSVSPKLAHQQGEARRIVPDPAKIRKMMAAYDYQLKFVVKDTRDLLEMERFLAELETDDPERVIVMPEGTTRDIQLERMPDLSEICAQKQYRLIPRLHTLIWGDQRGK